MREVVVTGPSAPPITSLEDLSGKEVFVRKSSRYWPNLERLNERLRSQGRAPAIIKEAEAEGLNANVWFNNVELIAAKEIGAETVTYVSNIYKYYVAYQMASENAAKKRTSKQS